MINQKKTTLHYLRIITKQSGFAFELKQSTEAFVIYVTQKAFKYNIMKLIPYFCRTN